VLNFCVDGSLNAQGTFDLTTGRGAQLHGTIDEYLADALNAIHVTVTGGTKRFAGATGSLVLSITQHDQTNCDPRVNVCFNWQEHGTIAGSIRLHRHHR
jgi:hypothetical protein